MTQRGLLDTARMSGGQCARISGKVGVRISGTRTTILVYERQGWEYEVVSRTVDQLPLSQGELNALGKDGWELVGVVALSNTVQFYFKRILK